MLSIFDSKYELTDSAKYNLGKWAAINMLQLEYSTKMESHTQLGAFYEGALKLIGNTKNLKFNVDKLIQKL